MEIVFSASSIADKISRHADLVLLDDSFNVVMTVVKGEVVFSTQSENIS